MSMPDTGPCTRAHQCASDSGVSLRQTRYPWRPGFDPPALHASLIPSMTRGFTASLTVQMTLLRLSGRMMPLAPVVEVGMTRGDGGGNSDKLPSASVGARRKKRTFL